MTDRRRRRVVREHPQETTRTVESASVEPATDDAPTWPSTEVDTGAAERGLRGLVGGGSSQVSPGAALRARDAARPRPQDLAHAEANLTIVRRHWTPHD